MSRSLAALAYALAAHVAHAQVYKCTDAQGKTIYQQQPCSGTGAQLQPKTEPQPQARPADAKPAPAGPPQSTGNRNVVVFPNSAPLTEPPGTNAGNTSSWRPRNSFEASFTNFVTAKRGCDHFKPGFTARTDADYQRWRQRHAAEINAIETDPAYLKWRGPLKPLQSPSGYEHDGECDKWADIIAIGGAVPDPLRATPQKAWTTLVTAVNTGDRAYLRRTTLGMVSYGLQQKSDDPLAALRVYVKGAGPLDIEVPAQGSATGQVRRDDGVTLDVSLVPFESNWYVAVIEIARPR